VVFLGEYHRIRHDPLLVQTLLDPLYHAGVRRLAFEFARREDQGMIDELLAAPLWDEAAAREIVFRQSVAWGYTEYVDILRAAWGLNRSLPEGEAPFRILGMNDSPDWSYIRTESDLNSSQARSRVWGDSSERYWADVIIRAVESGEKVLAYSGIHHAFTRYRQPVVSGGKFVGFSQELRCGNYVYQALGDGVVTVFLHAPWSQRDGYEARSGYPADGVIDSVMLGLGPRPVGFGVATGPFGSLPVQDAVYANGYPTFRVSDFCDGWIYSMPLGEYEGVNPIVGWVNESNLERARAQFPNPAFRTASAGTINRAIAKDAEIARRFAHFG
jgi:hypothetical protein